MIAEFNGKRPEIAPSAFVSQAAYIVGDVEIGEGASIWPGAVIRGDFGKIIIGKYTCVEDNSVLHGAGDLVIEENVIIGHGAVVHCRKVGNHVLIGSHATLLDGAEIGEFSIIAAGALVNPKVRIPPRSLVTGVPGKIIGEVKERQINRLRKGSEIYRALAQEYKRQGL